MKNVIRIAIAAITVGIGAGAAQAGHSDSGLIREAHRVVDYADQLTREVNLHFRHSAEYRHLLADAAKIRQEAQHIDKLSHDVRGIADVRHLRADLEDLDELVHHIGDVIEEINHGHGAGHTHGDTRHVEKLVACINRSLHSMERTVSELERRYGCGRDSGHGHGYDYGRPSLGEHIAGEVLREVFGRGRH